METKDLISIGLSGVALITTVVWNLLNRRHTDKVARQIRGEGFAFDEWKSQRAEILRTLRAFEDGFDRLRLLTGGAHSADELAIEIEKEGKALTSSHAALFRELERVDVSWGEFAYGADLNGERDWDLIHTLLDDARQQTDAGEMRLRLQQLQGHGSSIRTIVGAELRVKTSEHDPIKF